MNQQTTKCRKCGTNITIDFGNLTRTEAEAAIEKLDRSPMECPGFHTELTGWRRMWNLDELLEAQYPLPLHLPVSA